MPDQNVAAAEIRQHRAAHFTGPGALGMFGNILRAPGDAAAVEHGPGLRQVGVGHADGDLGTALGAIAHGLQQPKVGGQAAMHFPVSSNKFGAHVGSEAVDEAQDYSGCAALMPDRLAPTPVTFKSPNAIRQRLF
jgi:hypothetical protein